MQKLITGALLLAMTTASAQAHAKNTRTERIKGIDRIKVLTETSKSAAKTTATLWRVSAVANYDNSGSAPSLQDSSKYVYSNGRGSMFDYSELSYNDYGIESDVLYDTVIRYQDMGSGAQLSGRDFISYNSNNKALNHTQQQMNSGQMTNTNKTVVVRDGNDNPVKNVSLTWNSGNWDTSFVSIMTYDAQGHLLSDSSYTKFGGVASPAYRTKYTYDGSWNLVQYLYDYWDGTMWTGNSRTNFTYNGTKLVTTTDQEYVNSSWRNSYMDSIGYNGSGIYNFYESREWDTVGAKWVNSEQEIHTINGNGVPSKVLYSEWNTGTKKWDPYSETEVFYDANGNPVRTDVYDYTGGIKDNTPYYINYMYYEYYFNVGVNNVPQVNVVSVYPNPASNNVYIVMNDIQEGVITLTNMAGQVVRTISAVGNQKVSLDITGLATGNYILSVQSKGMTDARQMLTIQ
ncbi:MAG: T9SS type A sorting domain-containing protein [Chitinophagales bacterium]|nr:T9SS type A sorting domain-containing protein [Chitinophagales bacterium]